jgi:hypothetical protein
VSIQFDRSPEQRFHWPALRSAGLDRSFAETNALARFRIRVCDGKEARDASQSIARGCLPPAPASASVPGLFDRAHLGYSDCNKLKGVRMIGAGGLVVSVIAVAVGAILDWAVTEPYQHGFNLNKVGWILMLVGAIGAVLSIIVMVAGNTRRRHTVVDDGRGNVVRRVDSTY